jgi:hypothetical protein
MTTRTQLAYAAAGVVLVLGLLSLLNPWLAARLLGFELATPRAVSEVRATYGALHVTMAALLLWAIPLRPRAGLVVRVAGILWAGAAAGRTASLVIDGVIGPANLGLLLVQVAVAAVLVWASFETPPSGAELRTRREVAAAKRRAEAARTVAPAPETREDLAGADGAASEPARGAERP